MKLMVVCASLFALSMLLHVVIHGVYPYGFLNADTHGYLTLAQNFHVLQASGFDWIRTIPFGGLLLLSMYFPQPTAFVFWVHAVLFSFGMALIPWACSPLFVHRRSAMLLGFVALAIETLIMRVPFQSLEMLSDPSYAYLVFIGLLLVLTGFLRRPAGVRYQYIGCALLGIASFERQTGIALYIILLPFLAYDCAERIRSGVRLSRAALCTATCVILMLLPTYTWAARNAMLYGEFSASAAASRHLLPSLLPLVGPDEHVFADPIQNETFLRELDAFEAAYPQRNSDAYRWMYAEGHLRLMDTINGFTSVADDPSMAPDLLQLRRIFAANVIGMRAAVGIILRHPGAFALQTLHLYISYFNASAVKGMYSENRNFPVQKTYQMIAENLRTAEVLPLYYPGIDLNNVQANPFMLRVLYMLRSSFYLQSFPGRALLQAAMVHVFIIMSFACAFYARERRVRDAAVVCVVLACTACSHYLLATIIGVAWQRYALPGDLILHLSVLIGISVMVPWQTWYGYLMPTQRSTAAVSTREKRDS